jgi:hypothetical protein
MPLPKLKRRLWDQTLHKRLSKWEISLKKLSNARNATHKLARRIKNTWTRFAKKHIQISINKLRDRKKIIPELVHKSDIIQCEAIIYLDDVGTEHLTLLVIPKSHTLLVWQGVRPENNFLFPVLCREQPESVSHVISKPLSITYIIREEVDGSVLGLLR